MNCRHMILVAALSFCTANAYSQPHEADASSTFEFPSEPLLHPAPAFSQWTITFSYPEDQKENSPDTPAKTAKPIPENLSIRPRTIITTKTGEIIHEETLTVGGKKTENWQVHGDYYIKFPAKSFWSAYEKPDSTQIASGTGIVMGLPSSGFRGLDWISRETYAGKFKTSLGNCLVFVPGGRNTVPAGTPGKLKELESLPTIAYIDAETRLPILVRAAGETRMFKFTQPPPTSIQTLPDELADEIKKGDEIRAKRNAAPQREY